MKPLPGPEKVALKWFVPIVRVAEVTWPWRAYFYAGTPGYMYTRVSNPSALSIIYGTTKIKGQSPDSKKYVKGNFRPHPPR